MDVLKPALKGQYHAALDMLKDAVVDCPDALWERGSLGRQFWNLAYHALYWTEMYLQIRAQDFVPWELHVKGEDRMKPEARPYTRREILTYWARVDATVDSQIDRIDLDSQESGFDWYDDVSKLDHVLMNLRHIQEHAGQLRDRLLEAGIDQDRWVSKR